MIEHPPRTDAATPLSDAVTKVAEEIAALLRSCGDGGTPIPGARWTVAEAAAHLVLANRLMADIGAGRARSYGDGTAGSLAAANDASLAAYTERDPRILAEGIVQHAAAFTAAAARRPPGEPTDTPLGPMDLATLGSYLLTHMLGHGYDMAVALGRPHMIDARRVALTLPFLTTVMPRVTDPRTVAGHNACYELRVRGGSRFAVTFTDGAAAVSAEPPRRPHCTILTEPVTFFLIALGRCDTTAAVARGKILAWGRKPWLAPAFPTRFAPP